MIVAYLFLTISRDPNPMYCQQKEKRWLVTEVHFPGAYIPTASRTAD